MSEHTFNDISNDVAATSLTSTTSQNHPEILALVSAYLIEIMELEEDELEIGMTTHFQDDLELESIEMIALGDALRTHYQQGEPTVMINFAHWLTQLSIEQLMNLTVGDLVLWIAGELNAVTD